VNVNDLSHDILYRCEMRDSTGQIKHVMVELDVDEVSSVRQHIAKDQLESAAALSYGYAARKALAAAPAGFFLHDAVRAI
jgi:hypothetical protein